MVGGKKFGWWGKSGVSADDVTYFGDSSGGTVTFGGSTTDSISVGEASYGHFFVDGS